jgi:hypothetical protein
VTDVDRPAIEYPPPDEDAEPGPETIDATGEELYDLPEVFLTADGPNEPTRDKITRIWISKKLPDKTLSSLDWRRAEDLASLKDLELAFGPGTYCLLGRGEKNGSLNLRKVYQTVGDPEEFLHGGARAMTRLPPPPPAPRELDIGKIVTALAAIFAPIQTIYQTYAARQAEDRRIEREAQERRATEERERIDRHHTELMQVVTGIQNSRIEELHQRLAQPQQKSGADSSAAYQQGQADAIAMLQAAKEEGLVSDGGEDKLLQIAMGFMSGAAHRAPEPPPPKDPGANGSVL